MSAPARRFWSKVDKQPQGCWLWTATKDKGGYGRFDRVMAHRRAYELTKGPIPEGLEIRHTCDVRDCVNPDHLLVGTHADNMADCAERNRTKEQTGDANWRTRISDDGVRDIRRRAATGETYWRLAREYGVALPTISRIVVGTRRGSVSS